MTEKTTFISCTDCRSHKIKCGGERPTCGNCQRKRNICHYDSIVKRRGPDKHPGGRLKHGTFVHQFLIEGSSAGEQQTLSKPIVHGILSTASTTCPGDSLWLEGRILSPSPVINGQSRTECKIPLYLSPGQTEKASEIWWGILRKRTRVSKILDLCKRFFADGNLWFNFLHRGLFFQGLSSYQLGPQVVFAILAHMTFLQDGKTRIGQLLALQYAEEARKMIDYCLIAGSKEPSLAQAALLLVAFEFQPHIQHTVARATAALGYMDSCARACLSFQLDRDNPHVCLNMLDLPRAQRARHQIAADNDIAAYARKWANGPTWSYHWSVGAIRKEEMRRMCWTLSQLEASSTVWRHMTDRTTVRIVSADPTKFALLFPAEATFQDEGRLAIGKISIWALCHRAVSLWYIALYYPLNKEQKLSLLEQVRGIEIDAALYDEVGARNYVWQAREWSLATRGHLGDIDLEGITAWFRKQTAVLANFAQPQGGVPKVTDRPTYCWWYLMVAYTALRFCMQVHGFESTTDLVLDYVYEALDLIASVWPCSTLEHQYERLRNKHALVKAARHRCGPVQSKFTRSGTQKVWWWLGREGEEKKAQLRD